ncbi:PREDICTED: olfactory receptor 14J1-like [Nanorana parkeri]|uniref:olfactory receptor 14J1-like n=1 Tax=Nanorana parkeri TaxID=125878 RepID=UPI0008548341|nr:PREDICTED: olfactory receptor 14J1-like [Nanorana parkeri]
MNITLVQGNVTHVLIQSEKYDLLFRTILMMVTLITFLLFLCFNGALLSVFFTTPHIQENSRYILFAHILITDTLYLTLGTLVLFSILNDVYFPTPFCLFILAAAATSFRVTPYNLAVMSLERYVAICFPLRHFEFCTARRAKSAMVVIWAVGFSPSIADFVTIVYSVERNFFSRAVLCTHLMLTISPLQNVIRSFVHILSFTLVALIILFTYVKVMLVAKRLGSQESSALKAAKTVLLHVFQLMLCMVAFISTVLETTIADYNTTLRVSGFLIFTCLPRFLSPLIYGMRDEVFRKYIRKLYHISPLVP